MRLGKISRLQRGSRGGEETAVGGIARTEAWESSNYIKQMQDAAPGSTG